MKLTYPVRALQFGEGNFLRGFVDWMLYRMNQSGLFQGKVVVIQPIRHGLISELNQHNGEYTLLLRGVVNGKAAEIQERIDVIDSGVNPYQDYDSYLKCAEIPDLQFIFSNTTEAGIVYSESDQLEDRPADSFPGKLTQLLYHRFRYFHGAADKGLFIIPCELIEDNGSRLKDTVLKLADRWQLGNDFRSWIEQHHEFANTLVDRIVSGYPQEEAEKLQQKLGYRDPLLNTAEMYHLWVIAGSRKLIEQLPLDQAGLNVVWTDDITPYRARKVRILNGAHTVIAALAFLYGKSTVKDAVDDPMLSEYLKQAIEKEIIPAMDLPQDELTKYAETVLERFSNPFIHHQLLSITLNSTAKFKTRVLPSILDYWGKHQQLPRNLIFSLAGLIVFYKGTEIREGKLVGRHNGAEYLIQDDVEVLEQFKELWGMYEQAGGGRSAVKELVDSLLARERIWGQNLLQIGGLAEQVSANIDLMLTSGIKKALHSSSFKLD